MANATLSPKQLAALLSMLDDAQRRIASVREEVILAMASRRRTRPSSARQAPKAAAGRAGRTRSGRRSA
jgi:hypothetical protein